MTAHIAIAHPNSPSKPPKYEGDIDCEWTADNWTTVMQRAEKLRATLTRAIVEASMLEQSARDNGITCNEGMDMSLTCTVADLGLDGLIERIDAEVTRFFDR